MGGYSKSGCHLFLCTPLGFVFQAFSIAAVLDTSKISSLERSHGDVSLDKRAFRQLQGRTPGENRRVLRYFTFTPPPLSSSFHTCPPWSVIFRCFVPPCLKDLSTIKNGRYPRASRRESRCRRLPSAFRRLAKDFRALRSLRPGAGPSTSEPLRAASCLCLLVAMAAETFLNHGKPAVMKNNREKV